MKDNKAEAPKLSIHGNKWEKHPFQIWQKID